jgi:hypothetical protein
MVYITHDYWEFGPCLPSGILKNTVFMKLDPETGPKRCVHENTGQRTKSSDLSNRQMNPVYIPSASPQSSSLSSEAGTIGQEWPQCQ